MKDTQTSLVTIFLTSDGEILKPDEFRYAREHNNDQTTAVKAQTGETVFGELIPDQT